MVNREELGFRFDRSKVSVFALHAEAAELLGASW